MHGSPVEVDHEDIWLALAGGFDSDFASFSHKLQAREFAGLGYFGPLTHRPDEPVGRIQCIAYSVWWVKIGHPYSSAPVRSPVWYASEGADTWSLAFHREMRETV
jgi:hypothetical protein